jgi:hypothetical protein
VHGKDHFTRLWPTAKDGSPSGFLLVMLPIRFVAWRCWGHLHAASPGRPGDRHFAIVTGLLLARHSHGARATAPEGRPEAGAAIRTIEREEDGTPPTLQYDQSDQCCPGNGTARARWAGLPRQSPARGAPDPAPQAPP